MRISQGNPMGHPALKHAQVVTSALTQLAVITVVFAPVKSLLAAKGLDCTKHIGRPAPAGCAPVNATSCAQGA